MYVEDLVFRILCPVDKVDTVAGESDGIIELLQNEIGVDVKILNPVASSDEQVIIISSDEVLPLLFLVQVSVSYYRFLLWKF